MNGSSRTRLPLASICPQRRSCSFSRFCVFLVTRNQGWRWVLSEFTKNILGARRNRAISFAATAWTTGLGAWSDGRHTICPLRGTLVPSHLAVTMLDAFRLPVHLQSPWSQKSAEPLAQSVTPLWNDCSKGFLAEGLSFIDLVAQGRADTALSARMKKKKVPLPEMGSDVVLVAQQKRPW